MRATRSIRWRGSGLWSRSMRVTIGSGDDKREGWDSLCRALSAPESGFSVLTPWRCRPSPCRMSAGRAFASIAAQRFAQRPCRALGLPTGSACARIFGELMLICETRQFREVPKCRTWEPMGSFETPSNTPRKKVYAT